MSKAMDFTKNAKTAKEISEANPGSIDAAAEAVNAATDAGALDSSLEGVSIPQPQAQVGNTLIPPEVYEAHGTFEPSTVALEDRTRGLGEQTSGAPKEGFAPHTLSDQKPKRNKKDSEEKELDLATLDESNIMLLPFIEAKAFDIPKLMDIKPKDPALRFRWVNFKNNEGSNYSLFKAMGFENVKPEDIDGEYAESFLKEDGTIKYYDVIAMKINVLVLMARYKRNIMRSMVQVGQWDKTAIAEAQKTFANNCSNDLLAALKRAGMKIEFYAPTVGEVRSQNPNFGG